MTDSLSHTCDALLLMCIDWRFWPWLLPAVKERFGTFDLVTRAGGALPLVSDNPDEREIVLSQIRIAKKLHGFRSVVIVDHEDCGAYGGSKAFASPEEEHNAHREKLSRAAGFVKEALPDLNVVLGYATQNQTLEIFNE